MRLRLPSPTPRRHASCPTDKSIIFPFVIVAACLGVFSPTGEPGVSAAEPSQLDLARRHFDASRYQDAIAVFDAVLEKDPTPEAYYWRGECLRKTWWLAPAADDFQQAIKLNPREARAYFARGLVHEYQGYWDLAAADYDAAVEHNPKLALAYVRRGGLRWKHGQIDEATADLKRGIELCNAALESTSGARGTLQTYRARALAWRTLEQYDRAIEDCGRMIQVDPESIEAYIGRGRTLAQKYEKASPAADPAARQRDKAASVADFDRAIALATAAIRRQPRDAQGYRLRTEAHDARAFAWHDPEDFRRAVADCTQVLELAEGCPTAYFRRGHLHAGASHFAGDPTAGASHFRQAEADLGRVVRLEPGYAAAWHERGLLYVRAALGNQQPELALRGVADLTEMIRLVPKGALAYCARGSAYGLAGDYARALADFDQAVRLCPKMADAYALRGGANLALGKQDAARADLARAQELRTRTR